MLLRSATKPQILGFLTKQHISNTFSIDAKRLIHQFYIIFNVHIYIYIYIYQIYTSMYNNILC